MSSISSAIAIAGLAASLLAGCSDPPGARPADAGTDTFVPSCALGFLGSDSKPVEMTILVHGIGAESTEIADGARVPLILPPQGGRVVFVGVKATNLGACAVTLTGSVRDTTNRQVRVDVRTVNLEPRGDGWGESTDSDLSTFTNVPLCPNQWATTDIFESSFELALTVTDSAGRTATKTIQATPYCGETQYAAECMCECQKGYILGQQCADGGK